MQGLMTDTGMDDELDTPNFHTDLVPTQVADVGGTVAWLCPECGLVKL